MTIRDWMAPMWTEALFEAEQVAEHLMSCIVSLISPLICGL